MLKINKYEYINDEEIEAICSFFHSKPLTSLIHAADEEGRLHRMQLKHKIKCMIFCEGGDIYLCPYTPETYMKRLDASDYMPALPKKCYFKKSCVREITSKMTEGQRRNYADRKKENRYVRLSGRKKTGCWVIMRSGMIYGLNSIKDPSVPLSDTERNENQ